MSKRFQKIEISSWVRCSRFDFTTGFVCFIIHDCFNYLRFVWWFTCQTSPSSTRYGASPGEVLGSVVAFAGVGLFGLPAGIISSGFAEIFSSRGAVPGAMV